jgi:hypothetical protein
LRGGETMPAKIGKSGRPGKATVVFFIIELFVAVIILIIVMTKYYNG